MRHTRKSQRRLIVRVHAGGFGGNQAAEGARKESVMQLTYIVGDWTLAVYAVASQKRCNTMGIVSDVLSD